jgi:hypothetical protein
MVTISPQKVPSSRSSLIQADPRHKTASQHEKSLFHPINYKKGKVSLWQKITASEPRNNQENASDLIEAISISEAWNS